MKTLDWNIIKVFKDFTSQEGLEIFTFNKFYTYKVSKEKILLYGGKFYRVTTGLVICMIIIIWRIIFLKM